MQKTKLARYVVFFWFYKHKLQHQTNKFVVFPMLKVAEVFFKNEQNYSSFLSTKCLLIVSNKIFTTVNKYFQKIKVMCGRLSKCWYHTASAELSRRTSGEEECWYFSCVTRILAAVVQQITQLGPRIVNTFYLPNFLSISLSLTVFAV